MNELMKNNEIQTMSSKEIAELTGKQHGHVMRDIKNILDEVGIDDSKFGVIYKDSMNREKPCYNLPYRECNLIISGYSALHRLKIIDRWQELEAKQPKPMTTLQLLEHAVAEIKAKEAENIKLNTIIDNVFGYCSILRASIFLGVSEKTFSWRPLKDATLRLGMEVKRVPSPRFGYMNLYPLTAFKEIYTDYDFDDLTPEMVADKSELALITNR